MARSQFQYCQIEIGSDSNGILRQFFSDRTPNETQLYTNWPAMIGKLGDQGWDMVNVLSGGRRGPLIYVFKRKMSATPGGVQPVSGQQVVSAAAPANTPQPQPQPPVEFDSIGYDDDEDDDNGDFEPLRGI